MTQTSYSPGLHQLLTLSVPNSNKLTAAQDFVLFTDTILQKYQLEKVGVVVHSFENDSFTIAVCLKESHICIHTWPEYNQLTMDIYLCNYLQDNTVKVKTIANDYIEYFQADVIKNFEINR
ncbi:adenosylmethionine decarboxylase [Flavobacterium supellecticarium]|uniref:Adenosylmethionine decarboxylase n=1 Tax=Flavobacterium supellecticarium TaxID=2565924 RepID=A0A4S3ZSA5_9FLAO|nr:S-adenosylmethionine decarboxylase [Flavobacterium supellecticarium]THF48540.1 adenosylmethionine decarboxylase [Flavobacterium supellecticarium]